MAINRAYSSGEIPKTPAEKQKELDAKMKKFLESGGKVEQCEPGAPKQMGSMEHSGKPHWTDAELKAQYREKHGMIHAKTTKQKGSKE